MGAWGFCCPPLAAGAAPARLSERFFCCWDWPLFWPAFAPAAFLPCWFCWPCCRRGSSCRGAAAAAWGLGSGWLSAKYSSRLASSRSWVKLSSTTSSSSSVRAVIYFLVVSQCFCSCSITNLLGTFRSLATSCTRYLIIIRIPYLSLRRRQPPVSGLPKLWQSLRPGQLQYRPSFRLPG